MGYPLILPNREIIKPDKKLILPSNESNIQLLHLNTNGSIEGVTDNLKDVLWGLLSFFFARTPEAIYSTSNVSLMIDEYLKIGGDVIGFTEVFGKQQRDFVANALESRGYKVFVTDAFEMWSQDFEGEHLYNVLGIKDSSIEGEPVISYLKNKRKTSAKICSITYFLNGLIENGIIGTSIEDINRAKNIYNRLVNGILDGSIMLIDCGDLIVNYHHFHPDNGNLPLAYEKHVSVDKASVILGDFNQGGNTFEKFLLKAPFNGEYISFMPEGDITYPNSYGLKEIKLIQNTIDNIIGNKHVKNIETKSIGSKSDHRGVKSIIRVK